MNRREGVNFHEVKPNFIFRTNHESIKIVGISDEGITYIKNYIRKTCKYHKKINLDRVTIIPIERRTQNRVSIVVFRDWRADYFIDKP